MREYLLTLFLAAALCYVVTPLVRTWGCTFLAQLLKFAREMCTPHLLLVGVALRCGSQ
jgi:hypothetical protein